MNSARYLKSVPKSASSGVNSMIVPLRSSVLAIL